jgi:two-component system, NarL family, nitrate/nitrite response regulator NarL
MYGPPPPAILGHVALRCLIVDDNGGFRDAARSLLEREEIEVVGVASNSTEARSRVEELRPDVVLVDIQLPDSDGFQLSRELTARPGAPAVVLVSGRPRSDYGRLVERSGARGFIDKAEFSGPRLRAVLA